MSKLRSLFLDNIWWKLISLALAILLWLVGMNINNPELTKSYSIPITFKNYETIAENGLVLLNEDTLSNTRVSINVRATRQKLETLSDKDIKAEIDFEPINITNRDYAGQIKPIEIILSLPSGYEYNYYTPRTVDLKFDAYSTKEFEVNIIKTGKPAENHDTLSNWTSTPDFVKISGAQSDLDKISTVGATVDVTGATSTVEKIIELIIYDTDSNAITDLFELSQKNVSVKVPIYMYSTIPINAQTWIGAPANGFEVTDIIVEPYQIEVFGDQADIDKLKSIDLSPANVNGAQSNIVQTYNINELLSGSNLDKKNGTGDDIVVTYVVKPIINKVIKVPIENFSIENLTTNEVELPTYINVTVYGNIDLVESITSSDISGLIDFAHFNSEIGDVNVDILDLPAGISASTPISINVNIPDDNVTDDEIINTTPIDTDALPANEEEIIDDTETIAVSEPTENEDINE